MAMSEQKTPERQTDSPVPYGDYPFMFARDQLSAEHQAWHAERYEINAAFARELFPERETGEYTELEQKTIVAIAEVLTATDYRLGRNTGGLGTQDIWGEAAMPTFYHNGDGTRLAMRGASEYMKYVNSRRDKPFAENAADRGGEASPYRGEATFCKTLLAAAYDDLVFGAYGRGGDERASAALAREHLLAKGFEPEFVNDVVIAIEASIFNEETGKQNYDPTRGAEAEQHASLDGDLRDLGGARGTAKVFMLLIENMWKKDTAGRFGQILRQAVKAEREAQSQQQYTYQTMRDFFDVIERHPDLKQKFGQELAGNGDFLLEKHRYIDPNFEKALRNRKQQNATLQRVLGVQISAGTMTVEEAFHCAVSYAAASLGYTHPDQNEGDIALPDNISPDDISEILLLPDEVNLEGGNMLPVESFLDKYIAELSERRSASTVKSPERNSAYSKR
jgi:hypothetical protein